MAKGKVKLRRTSLIIPTEWYRDIATESILRDVPIYKLLWQILFEHFGRQKGWDSSVLNYTISRSDMEAEDDE